MRTRRVFVSMPADRWLSDQENELKWAIVSRVETLGYQTEVFFDPRGTPSLAGPRAWSATECERVMRHCDGCVLLGFPRWRFGGETSAFALPTEFNHYEGALAYTLRLPLLVLVQDGVERRVVFDRSYDGYVGTLPDKPTLSWLSTNDFQVPFKFWKKQLSGRRDAFLGYCSTSSETASKLKEFMERDLDVNVLDWATDFAPGRTILEQIQEASTRCSAGVFLFTQDDKLSDRGKTNRAVPRDNVVFEAGYFIGVKGKAHVLVVRQAGAKMPADLGGDIYASMDDKADIEPVKPALRKFFEAL